MSKTVTGTYTLRPTTYRQYISSGTFSNYFSTSVSAPSSWTTKMNVTTEIGDQSDSTYYSDTGVSSSNTYAENAIMNLHLSSGSVPQEDYQITKIKVNWRAQASAQTDGYRKLNIWNTIWDSGGYSGTPKSRIDNGAFGHMLASGSSSSVHTATTSIEDHSQTATSFENPTINAGDFPDRLAICVQAYKTSGFVSFSWWRLYEVWIEVSYTYEKNVDVTATIKADSGTTVSGDATVQAGTNEDITFDEGTVVSLTATPSDGYVFDGWYSGGSKVAETTTYSFTISAAVLYAISHKRNLYVGDARVKEVYIGTTKIGEIYSGDEPIWKDSELLAEATGGTS